MTWGVDIKAELGGDDIAAMLRGWKPAIQRRIERPAIRKASQLVRDRAKARVPVESGLLRKSLGYVVRTYNNAVVGVVGPRVGFRREVAQRLAGRRGEKHVAWSSTQKAVSEAKQGSGIFRTMVRNPVKYAHLVEGGTAPHSLGMAAKRAPHRVVGLRAIHGTYGFQKKRQHPGATAKPFLRPAFEESLPRVREIIRREIGKGIKKEAQKLLKKRGSQYTAGMLRGALRP